MKSIFIRKIYKENYPITVDSITKFIDDNYNELFQLLKIYRHYIERLMINNDIKATNNVGRNIITGHTYIKDINMYCNLNNHREIIINKYCNVDRLSYLIRCRRYKYESLSEEDVKTINSILHKYRYIFSLI